MPSLSYLTPTRNTTHLLNSQLPLGQPRGAMKVLYKQSFCASKSASSPIAKKLVLICKHKKKNYIYGVNPQKAF